MVAGRHLVMDFDSRADDPDAALTGDTTTLGGSDGTSPGTLVGTLPYVAKRSAARASTRSQTCFRWASSFTKC
jgi:hypothetical protein